MKLQLLSVYLARMFSHQIKASHQSGMRMSDYEHSTDKDGCILHLKWNCTGFDLLRELSISLSIGGKPSRNRLSIVCRHASLVDSQRTSSRISNKYTTKSCLYFRQDAVLQKAI